MTKKYLFRSLGMLGQMYDESGEEEINFPEGTLFYLCTDVDRLAHEPPQNPQPRMTATEVLARQRPESKS
jgi:hypothetical protein